MGIYGDLSKADIPHPTPSSITRCNSGSATCLAILCTGWLRNQVCRCALPFSGQRRCSRAEIQGSNASDTRQHWAKRDCPARCSRDRKTEKLTPCCRYPHLQRGTCRKADIAKTPRTLGISGKRKTPRTSVLRVSRQCWRSSRCEIATFLRCYYAAPAHLLLRNAKTTTPMAHIIPYFWPTGGVCDANW